MVYRIRSKPTIVNVINGFWYFRQEHLDGVLFGAISLDLSRNWEIVGPERQVRRYTKMLKEADGATWRAFLQRCATAFYSTDVGAFIEIGRETKDGPVRGLYSVDSTKIVLTGDQITPVAFYEPNRQTVAVEKPGCVAYPMLAVSA